MPNKVCKRVLYEGRVQGVGFRFTAVELAAGYAVVGWVRNLPTGDVELVAEGAADQVDGFLAAIAERMAGNIAQATVKESTPTGQTGFHVR